MMKKCIWILPILCFVVQYFAAQIRDGVEMFQCPLLVAIVIANLGGISDKVTWTEFYVLSESLNQESHWKNLFTSPHLTLLHIF